MNFIPSKRNLGGLFEKPIAHRGLHDLTLGRVENCEQSFSAALAHGYAIECDIELSSDGKAMVFHDDDLDRLMDASGAVKSHTAMQLKNLSYKHGKDKMQTLPELLEQVAGRVPMVIEIKSLWDDDVTLTDRAIADLSSYKGQCALMSFDPRLVARVAQKAPHILRGVTADRVIDPYYDPLTEQRRWEMATFSHLSQTLPDFISFDCTQLPHEPITQLRLHGLPIITWTIRSTAQATTALAHCEQITFEGYLP